MEVAQRVTQGEIFSGPWVQIRNVADEAEGARIIQTLAAGGLDDTYLVRNDDEGLKISLGLFSEVERAERVELQARSLDLPAEISQKYREGDLFFVDIGLPPGRGAGSIIEKYGQERVLMRGAATCPK